MLSILECMSYLSWLSILILSFISKLGSYYIYWINSYLVCTVEIWGPKRYSSTKLEDETSYEFHVDRLYLRFLDYLSHSTDFYSSSNKNFQRHVSADNYFKHKESATSPSLTSAKKPITMGPKYDHPHHIQHKGEWLTITRTQLPNVSQDDYPFEKITISSKRRNRALIYDLLNTANKSQAHNDRKENSVQIHKSKEDSCPCCDESWEEMGAPRPGRPLSSVILADGVKERLVDDLKSFLKSREWYEQREIPYSRGYLLYGPPGSGKSSIIKAIASELQLDICLLTFTSPDLNDFFLSRHINSAPEKSIILIEDIDAAFKSREDELADPTDQNLSFGGAICSSKVTFSGLLNALDGVLVGGVDPRIIFMTTNHVDRLDPALIRPGRIDMKVCIDYPTDSQIRRLHARFYETEATNEDEAEDFLNAVRTSCGDVKVTMAMVQELLMSQRHRQQMLGSGWYKVAREYFKEELCPHKSNKQSQWGLYV